MSERLRKLLEGSSKVLERTEVPHVYIRCLKHGTSNKMQFRRAIKHQADIYNCPACKAERGREYAKRRYDHQ